MNKNQEGLEHSESKLFWEYVRLLEEVKPKYFLLENTHGNNEERGDNVHHLTTVAVRLLAHFQELVPNTSVAVATLTTDVAGRLVETNILEGIFKGLDIAIDYHWS